jgi:hypothetical protein
MKSKANEKAQMIDQSELRTNQLCVIAALLTSFVLDRWEVIAVQALFFALATLHPRLGPYGALYRNVLRPLGLARPDVRADNGEAHRFAGLVGMIVASSAAYLVASGHGLIGWGLVWLMVVLAAAAYAGWCAGCFSYYMLHRLGLTTYFRRPPINGVFPGARPPRPDA